MRCCHPARPPRTGASLRRTPAFSRAQLVRQDDAESLKIGSAGRGRTLDQPRQLERRLPQRVVLEEQPAAPISGVRILAGSK